ncbi:hypothetical protein [Marinomonas spartinae]|nr:hypothetical protein [Marinomonas spartinae]MBJ7555376.1 hypothetical protein [Marinomonas spartinae]
MAFLTRSMVCGVVLELGDGDLVAADGLDHAHDVDVWHNHDVFFDAQR